MRETDAVGLLPAAGAHALPPPASRATQPNRTCPTHPWPERGLLRRPRRQLLQLQPAPHAVVVQLVVPRDAALLQAGRARTMQAHQVGGGEMDGHPSTPSSRTTPTSTTQTRAATARPHGGPPPLLLRQHRPAHPQYLLALLHHARRLGVDLWPEAALPHLRLIMLPADALHALLQALKGQASGRGMQGTGRGRGSLYVSC